MGEFNTTLRCEFHNPLNEESTSTTVTLDKSWSVGELVLNAIIKTDTESVIGEIDPYLDGVSLYDTCNLNKRVSDLSYTSDSVLILKMFSLSDQRRIKSMRRMHEYLSLITRNTEHEILYRILTVAYVHANLHERVRDE